MNITIKSGQNNVEKAAIRWLNSRKSDYDDGIEGVYRDLEYSGCQSGIVSDLIYYTDTVKFYKKHQETISEMLQEYLSDTGYSCPAELFGDKWDNDDPLALDTYNQNLLAWFGFEEAARTVMNRAGYEA